MTDDTEDATGHFAAGKGWVIRESNSPAALSYQKNGGNKVRAVVREAVERSGLKWTETNALALRRGPYVVAAGLSESGPELAENHLDGHFLNLFDPEIKVLNRFDLKPDARALLLDLSAIPTAEPAVLAASCRTRNVRITAESITFDADGIANSTGCVLLAMSARPKTVRINGKELPDAQIDYSDKIVRFSFENSGTSKSIEIRR